MRGWPEEGSLAFFMRLFSSSAAKSLSCDLALGAFSLLNFAFRPYNPARMERGIYRIIDANFNRAREAIRVVEEFCRFVLNCDSLTRRAKQLRHELCAAINNLDADKLICSRDTLGDVGVGQVVDDQLSRNDLRDCLTAACKRLTEALRALAETVQIINPPLAKSIEKLRYDTYTLEKDIVTFADPIEKFKKVGLYVIISSNFPADVISITNKCVAGKADCIQLRAKDIPDDALLSLAKEFVKICRESDVLSIINDRIDIAVASGADGVHLGQNDLSVEHARNLELSPLIIGKSTHCVDQLLAARAENPTYIALGPVFETETKPGEAVAGLDYVTEAVKLLADGCICHVAIGGITVENIEQVLGAGAMAFAVCSAITDSEDPADRCSQFKAKIAGFKR